MALAAVDQWLGWRLLPNSNSFWRRLHVFVFCVRFVINQISRVGQNHIYTAYTRYFWLENHQIYGVYIRIYTALANPTNKV